MRIKLIGTSGVLIICAFIYYAVYDMWNLGPYFMGETKQLTGYITTNKIVPYGKKAARCLEFSYSVDNQIYADHYYVFNEMAKLKTGDSIILKVSISNPSKCKVVGYYKKKGS